MIQVLVQSGSNIMVEIINTKLGLCLVKKKWQHFSCILNIFLNIQQSKQKRNHIVAVWQPFNNPQFTHIT
jgi:hypothetical protein